MPAVTKAVNKVATRRTRRQNGNGNSNNTAEIEYNEVKPLIIKEQLPSVSPKVEMEVLKLKPVIPVERIQKARCGLPFNPASCPGTKRSDLGGKPKVNDNPQNSDSKVVCKKVEDNKSKKTDVQKENKESNNEDGSGDASIELDEMPYEVWLAMQGIVKSQSENICKIEKKSDNESELVKDDSKDDDQTSEVGDDHDSKVLISTMGKMKGEVKELLAKGNAEAKTKVKIEKLKSILQLLEDNKDEDDSDEPDLETAKEGQRKKIKDEAACKIIKENECKKKNEVKRQEQLQVQMSEEDEQKKIQEIMKKQKAEIESKKEKEKQDFIEKERIACKKQKEELSKKRPEEHEQMKAKNLEEDTEEDVICKIGVIVDDNLYTLDDSAHDLAIVDTSCSKDGHIKKVCFKGKEGSTCDTDLNTDSKEIDCGADTVELSTLTAEKCCARHYK